MRIKCTQYRQSVLHYPALRAECAFTRAISIAYQFPKFIFNISDYYAWRITIMARCAIHIAVGFLFTVFCYKIIAEIRGDIETLSRLGLIFLFDDDIGFCAFAFDRQVRPPPKHTFYFCSLLPASCIHTSSLHFHLSLKKTSHEYSQINEQNTLGINI